MGSHKPKSTIAQMDSSRVFDDSRRRENLFLSYHPTKVIARSGNICVLLHVALAKTADTQFGPEKKAYLLEDSVEYKFLPSILLSSLSSTTIPFIGDSPLLVYLVLLLSGYSIVYRFGEADRTPIICNPSFLTLRCQVKEWWLRLGEPCCSVISCTTCIYPTLTLHLPCTLVYLHYLHLDPVTLQ